MADAVIWTEGLTKQYSDTLAVHGVTFDVPRGSIFGFIGPSGSGKTTTIRLLTGVEQATSGDVRVLDRPPTTFDQATRARIGYMPQYFALYPDLTVWENLNFAASIYGLSPKRRKRMMAILDFVELTEHRRKSVRKISGGMQRRLSLAATLVHNPDLFFLDEPTAGIDPVLRQKFWNHFRELQQQGKTLFVTTQYVSEAAYCDRVGVLVEGELLTVDSPEGLRQQAFGGDLIRMEVESFMSGAHLDEINKMPFVKRVERVSRRRLHITVEEANVALPALMRWGDAHEITIKTIEEYQPPFDDVFVALIEKRERDVR